MEVTADCASHMAADPIHFNSRVPSFFHWQMPAWWPEVWKIAPSLGVVVSNQTSSPAARPVCLDMRLVLRIYKNIRFVKTFDSWLEVSRKEDLNCLRPCAALVAYLQPKSIVVVCVSAIWPLYLFWAPNSCNDACFIIMDVVYRFDRYRYFLDCLSIGYW